MRSPGRNAYIDFSKMTTSAVAVVTNVKRDGHRVVGFGFNSNGRYAAGGILLIRYGGMRPDRDVLQFDPVLSYGLVEYLRTLDMLREHGWSWRRVVRRDSLGLF